MYRNYRVSATNSTIIFIISKEPLKRVISIIHMDGHLIGPTAAQKAASAQFTMEALGHLDKPCSATVRTWPMQWESELHMESGSEDLR